MIVLALLTVTYQCEVLGSLSHYHENSQRSHYYNAFAAPVHVIVSSFSKHAVPAAHVVVCLLGFVTQVFKEKASHSLCALLIQPTLVGDGDGIPDWDRIRKPSSGQWI